MSTMSSRRGSRLRAVPLILLTFVLAVLGFAEPVPARAEIVSDPGVAAQVLEEPAPPQEDSEDTGGSGDPADDEGMDDAPVEEKPAPSPAPSEAPPSDHAPEEPAPPQEAPGPVPSPSAAPEPKVTAQKSRAEIPTPEGQSDQPAPPSQAKRVLENVHTDAVAVYLDQGRLALESQADVDGQLRKRFDPQGLLFHLGDGDGRGEGGKRTIRAGDAWDRLGYLGEPGDVFWWAPQVQDRSVVWPGFSTEDADLGGRADSFDISLLNVEGPGRVELLLDSRRVFSSEVRLSPWRITVPQHAHMNWAFTEPGTYTLTFEAQGRVGGKMQKARNDYTFVVGDLGAHTQDTAVTIEASSTDLDEDEPVLLTAKLDPQSAEGAVQFRDHATGTVLGHTPVENGQAQFRADALAPGPHRFVAEYVPTWSNDFGWSSSASVNVHVAGEVQTRPVEDDTRPVPSGEVTRQTFRNQVVVISDGRKATAGGDVRAKAKDRAYAGHWLSVWLPGQKNPKSGSAWYGYVQADMNGDFSVSLEGAKAAKEQRLLMKDTEGGAVGDFIGWDSFEIAKPPADGGGDGGGSGGGTGDRPGGGGSGGGNGPGKKAARQDCRPEVTLDHGHIDAFAVAAGNGKASMQVWEDVTGHRVLRQPESVLLKVKERALGRAPGPGETPKRGYVLPLSQDTDLIWPGWDTNRTQGSGYTDVSISITGVDGPGSVSLYTGSLGQWRPLLNGGGYGLPGTIREPSPAHTHAQWVFSEKGVYKLTAHAVATNPANGKKLQTATHTYVFQVGDVPLGNAFCGLGFPGADDAAAVNAAVDEHEAAALAAAQKNAKNGKKGETDGKNAQSVRSRGSDGDDGGWLSELFGGTDADPMLLAGLVGLGGGLLVSGIAGSTIWYVNRLRRIAPGPVAVAAA
ncbi:choice-of-anchor M domain-containing protein [Leucobacter sp. GX24907]